MKKKVIIISGTPGTGKTILSKELGKKLDINVLNIGDIALEKNLIISKDPERDTIIIDDNKLLPIIIKMIKQSKDKLIIEGHYTDIIPQKFVDIIIILRTNPIILEKRLFKKGYKKSKVYENVASEILGSCTYAFLNKYNKNLIFELDTSNLDIYEAVSILEKIINEKPENYKVGIVNWMKELKTNKELEKYFEY